MFELFPFNIKLFHFFNGFALKNHSLDLFFIFISKYLIIFLIFFFFFFFGKLIWKDKKIKINELILYFAGSTIAYGITFILKHSISAPRPFKSLENINLLLDRKDIFQSFPSGHTTLAFAFAISIFLYNKKWGLLALFFAILIAFGRIFTGVHFPLDVICGALIGLLVNIISYIILKNNNNANK